MNDVLQLRFVWAMLATAIVFGACCKPGVEVGSRGTRLLSAAVMLHRTSAKEVMITDAEGFGIVPGNVLRISTTGPVANSIVVEFAPFDTKTAPNSPQFAVVDLATGRGQILSVQQAHFDARFEEIGDVLPP